MKIGHNTSGDDSPITGDIFVVNGKNITIPININIVLNLDEFNNKNSKEHLMKIFANTIHQLKKLTNVK